MVDEQTTDVSKVRYAASTEEEMNEWVKVLSQHCGEKPATAAVIPLANKPGVDAETAAASAAAAKFAAATIFPDMFWSDSFGKSEEVSWSEFIRVYHDQAKCDVISSGTGPAMFCIANILSQGRLLPILNKRFCYHVGSLLLAFVFDSLNDEGNFDKNKLHDADDAVWPIC